MICANPDVVVHRGADPHLLRRRPGAPAMKNSGAGRSMPASRTLRSIEKRRSERPQSGTRNGAAEGRKLLAVGDGMMTDIAGAVGAGLDALFIAEGIHRPETDANAELSARR